MWAALFIICVCVCECECVQHGALQEENICLCCVGVLNEHADLLYGVVRHLCVCVSMVLYLGGNQMSAQGYFSAKKNDDGVRFSY